MSGGAQVESLSVAELRARNESMIENIGALRFSIARIEKLDEYRIILREVVQDCRIRLAADGHKVLTARIDATLAQTKDD